MSGTNSPRPVRHSRAARFDLPLLLASGGLTALALGVGEPQTGGTPRMAPRSQAAADPPQAGPPLRAYRTASCGCHTAVVAGYAIEGHVPAGAIRRLLRERPALAGIAVPGMPLGSPGTESSPASESYTMFGFRRDGSRRPFLRFEA